MSRFGCSPKILDIKTTRKRISEMSDTSESEVGELSQCPNLTLILNKARGKANKDDNIIADSVDVIKGKYRKSIVKRAVQPGLVCSTPFANQNGNLHSFSNFSTLSQQSDNLNDVEEVLEPVEEAVVEQNVTGRDKSVVVSEKKDTEKTLIDKEASVIRGATSDYDRQRSVIGEKSVSVKGNSFSEEISEKSHVSSSKKSLLAEISMRARANNKTTPKKTDPNDTLRSVANETLKSVANETLKSVANENLKSVANETLKSIANETLKSVAKETSLVQNSRRNERLETKLQQNDRQVPNCSKVSAKHHDKSAYTINKRRRSNSRSSNESADESVDDNRYYRGKSKYKEKKAESPKKVIVVKRGARRKTKRRSRSRTKKTVKYVYVTEASEEESDPEEIKKKKKKKYIIESESESYSSPEIVHKSSRRKQSAPPKASHHKSKRYDSPRGRSVSRKRQTCAYYDSDSPPADTKLKRITGHRRSRSLHKVRKSRKVKEPSSESELYEYRTRKYKDKSSKKKYRREFHSPSSFEEDDYVEQIPKHNRQNERTERYSYRPRSKMRVTEFKNPRTTHLPRHPGQNSHGRRELSDVESSDNYANKVGRFSKRETHISDKKNKVNETDKYRKKQPILPSIADATECSSSPQDENSTPDILRDYTLRIKKPGPSGSPCEDFEVVSSCDDETFFSQKAVRTLVTRKLSKNPSAVSQLTKCLLPRDKRIGKQKTNLNKRSLLDIVNTLTLRKATTNRQTIAVQTSQNNVLEGLSNKDIISIRDSTIESTEHETGAVKHSNKFVNVGTDSQNVDPNIVILQNVTVQKPDNPTNSQNISQVMCPEPENNITSNTVTRRSKRRSQRTKSIFQENDTVDQKSSKEIQSPKPEISKKKSIKTKIPIATKEKVVNHFEDIQENKNDSLYQNSPNESPQNFVKPDRRPAKNKRTLPCTKLDFGETEEVETLATGEVDESKPNDEDPKLLETTSQELQTDEMKLSAKDEEDILAEEKDINMTSDDAVSSRSSRKSLRISEKTEEGNSQRVGTYTVSSNSSTNGFSRSPKKRRNRSASLVESDADTGESQSTSEKRESMKGQKENIGQEDVFQLDKNDALSSPKSLEQSPRKRRSILRSMTLDNNDTKIEESNSSRTNREPTKNNEENTEEHNDLKNYAPSVSSPPKSVVQSPTVPKNRKSSEKRVSFVENESRASSPTRKTREYTKKNTKQEKTQENDIQLNTDEDVAENSSSHIFLKPKEIPKRAKRSVSCVSCVDSGISIDVTPSNAAQEKGQQYQKKKTTKAKTEKKTASQSNEFSESGLSRPTRNRKPLKYEEKFCLSIESSQDLLKQYQKLTGKNLFDEKPKKRTERSKTDKDASNVTESSPKKPKISNSGNKKKSGRPKTSKITENTADVQSETNISENVENSNRNNTETISESVIENTYNTKTSLNSEESGKNVRGGKKNVREHKKNVLRSATSVTKSISHFMEPAIDDIEPTLSLAEVSVEVSEFLENINEEINEAASDTTDQKEKSGVAEQTVKVAESPSKKSEKNADENKKKDETLRNDVTKASSTENTTNVQDTLTEITTEEVNVAESVERKEIAPIKKQVKRQRKRTPLNCPQPKKRNNTSKKATTKKNSTTDKVDKALKKTNESESNKNLAEDEPRNSPAENFEVPVEDATKITVQKENSKVINDVGSSLEIPVRENKKRKEQKKNSTKDVQASKKTKTSEPSGSGDAAGSTDDASEYMREWEKISVKINQLGQNDTEMYEVTDLHGYVALAPRGLVYYVNEKYKQIFRRIEGTNSVKIGDLFLTDTPPSFVVPKGVAVGIGNTGTGRVLLSYTLSEN